MPAALQIAISVLQLIPQLEAAGIAVADLARQAHSVISKGDPSPEDWTALDATMSVLRKQLGE